jgi:hypothetical protein
MRHFVIPRLLIHNGFGVFCGFLIWIINIAGDIRWYCVVRLPSHRIKAFENPH